MDKFRISLRGMLVLVAAIAMAIASLKYANATWRTIMIGVIMAVVFSALVVAVVDRGFSQAFAIGFTLVAIGYGFVVLNSSVKVISNQLNPELSFGFSRLPTTKLLRHLYTGLESGYWRDSQTGQRLPNFDPRKQSQWVKVVGGQAVPIDEFVEVPSQEYFIAIGQMWWSMLLGCIGGFFAAFIYRRRMRNEEKLPVER
jgi:predicted PurR-regulated permease PerM